MIKAKLSRKLAARDRNGVIIDLQKWFQKHPDERLSNMLSDLETQVEELVQRTTQNQINVAQQKRREDAIEAGLRAIITQITLPPPPYMLYLVILVAVALVVFGANRFFPFFYEPVVLKMTLNTKNPVAEIPLKKMIAALDSVSKGRFKIKVSDNIKTRDANDLLSKTEHDSIQILYSISYYASNNDNQKASLFFAGMPYPMGMDMPSTEHWFQSEGLALCEKYYAAKGVKPFLLGHSGAQWMGWFKKPIHSIADFKGLKMRMAGNGAKVLKHWGASIENFVPTPNLLDSFCNTKESIAFEWIGPAADVQLGLPKHFNYYYKQGWHEPNTTWLLFINKKTWTALTEAELNQDYEKIIAQYHLEITKRFELENERYLDTIKMNYKNVKILDVPQAILNAALHASDSLTAEYIEEGKKNNEPYMEDIYNSYKKYSDRSNKPAYIHEYRKTKPH
jgi:TRAP-type mannitol/chloroaromatic compound transport system substrate-binding protein